MKLAFCLFKYFPFGGLQRDFLEIAQRCQKKGHEIHVYTRSWTGKVPDEFVIHTLPCKLAFTNIGKDLAYIKSVLPLLKKHKPDVVVGFNKMPNLDVYFASDNCYAHKVATKSQFSKTITKRHRQRLYLENSLLDSKTTLLFIAPQQQQQFAQHYQLAKIKTHLLPPGIDQNLKKLELSQEQKAKVKKNLRIANNTFLILMVGSSFKTKGLDRSLQAFASLPLEYRKNTHLAIVGKGNEKPFQKLAQKLGIYNNITFVGTTPDVHKWYLSSDMLLHPSYFESAGKVILEACVTGLPVLTTANCGYAFYIEKANSGLVVPHPFSQQKLNTLLLEMRTSDKLRQQWSKNGWDFSRENDLYSQHETAASIIENLGRL